MLSEDNSGTCEVSDEDYVAIVSLIKVRKWGDLNVHIQALKKKGVARLQLAKLMHRIIHEARKSNSGSPFI